MEKERASKRRGQKSGVRRRANSPKSSQGAYPRHPGKTEKKGPHKSSCVREKKKTPKGGGGVKIER